jgi:predicted methyltransferase
MSSKNKKSNEILEQVAIKAQVEEGKELVRALLREIYKQGTIGSKALARKLRLPIPTIAAIRKELENIKLISRVKQGAILTEKGVSFVTRELGIAILDDYFCDLCEGSSIKLPTNTNELLNKIREFMQLRPTPRTEIDQAYGKPITALKRALLMLQNDDLENRNVLLLGDDDFTSLAIAMITKNVHITVIDIDKRLLEVIEKIAHIEKYPINCIHLDLRNEIPSNMKNTFDTILTDPPYTITGLKLFLSRATQALKNEKNRKIYLAYAHREPNNTRDMQQAILEHGLAIENIFPGFNIYEGAELFGNTSQLLILATTDNLKASTKKLDKDIPLYTGDINPTTRIYVCENGHEIKTGKMESFRTIEILKEKGCPICKSKTSFTRKETIRGKK